MFDEYLNADNSNDVNAALLEILPYYTKNGSFFEYVKSLATSAPPFVKA
jgi:hypothetical protein